MVSHMRESLQHVTQIFSAARLIVFVFLLELRVVMIVTVYAPVPKRLRRRRNLFADLLELRFVNFATVNVRVLLLLLRLLWLLLLWSLLMLLSLLLMLMEKYAASCTCVAWSTAAPRNTARAPSRCGASPSSS